ncbi:MAG: hypothetical protein MSH24_09320 [Lachnospiraceae bacterium]|nr:hypothetical protein [Lachnospiraceae bacterium]
MEKVLGSQIWFHGPADTKDYLIGGVAVEVQTNRKDAEVKNVLGNRVLVENDGTAGAATGKYWSFKCKRRGYGVS